MSRWNNHGWYPRASRRPPPAHGIKVKATGTTWWGQRWIEALAVVLHGHAGRLARGKSYARAGRAHDLVVQGGKVTAKVTGSRDTPYRVTIEITQLPAPGWSKAIAGMAERAEFAAELLAGQMPRQISEVFRDAGTSLFPAKRADLVTSCTCPDWGDPCKHVAATHYVLGEALDRDPFLLFELRGRTRAQVLDALRLARTGGTGKPARGQSASASSEPTIPGVTLEGFDPAAYDRPREELPALQLSFDEPAAHGAVLAQLGAPPAWQNDASPAHLLTPVIRAAAQRARTMAMAEPEPDAGTDNDAEGNTAPPTAPRRPRAKPASTPARPLPARPVRRRAAGPRRST